MRFFYIEAHVKPIAQLAEEAASPPGCAFFSFFLGHRNRKIHSKKLAPGGLGCA